MNELTADIYNGAQANKEQQARKRTTAQLPVFRDCSNLLFIVMRTMNNAPRKLTKALDETVGCATELLRSVAMANEVRGMERVAAINIALANANTLNTLASSLAFLGIIPKQTSKDFKKRVGRVLAQLIGWRESAAQQGHVPPGTPRCSGGKGGTSA